MFVFGILQSLFLLYESASGYALFERVESEQIGSQTPEVIATQVLPPLTNPPCLYYLFLVSDRVMRCAQNDLGRFSKLVRMKAFQPFVSAEQALENQNDISEGIKSLFFSLFINKFSESFCFVFLQAF
jgi:nucleolar protein 56